MPRIGAMRERVTIEQESRVADGGGGYPMAWSEVATVWAAVEPQSGREQLQAERVESLVDYRVTMRWRGDVTAGMRLLWGSVDMAITAVRRVDGRKRFLEIDAVAGGAV